MKKNIYYTISLLICILFSMKICAQKFTEIYKDTSFHFSFPIPEQYVTKVFGNDSTYLRISLYNEDDSSQIIDIYVYKTDGKVDLEKFSEKDKYLFGDLGELVDKKSRYSILIFLLNSIEKSYQHKNINTKLLFKCKANFGYVIMWRSLNVDESIYKDITENFIINVPFSVDASVWFASVFKGIGIWIIGIIGLAVFLGTAYLLGLIGVELKKNIIIIQKIKKTLSQQVKKSNFDVLYNARSKSKLRISIITIIIISSFLIVYKTTSLEVFLLSLLILVPIVMGYFGVFFTLSDDIGDYF